jgi:hypothetical protein
MRDDLTDRDRRRIKAMDALDARRATWGLTPEQMAELDAFADAATAAGLDPATAFLHAYGRFPDLCEQCSTVGGLVATFHGRLCAACRDRVIHGGAS